MAIEETKKYFEGFPEAPASDSFKWQDAQGYEHMLTLRAWHVKPLMNAILEAQMAIVEVGGKPISNQPKTMPPALVQATENGIPVINVEGEPVMIPAPAGVRTYNVKALFHDQTKNGKDVLKVVTNEEPYNTKYGVSCFHGGPEGWKAWALGVENKYVPSKGFLKVDIQDPEGENKYANILRFHD
jgi:hypothetical protein